MAIQILNQTLSSKAAQLYEQIQSQLSKPLNIRPISDLNSQGARRYGALDFSHNDAYYVYLSTDLHSEPFEVNMLHELHHIQQIEQGFPTVNSNNPERFNSQNKSYYRLIGAHLQSVVLDLDVWNWLTQREMNIRFFTKNYIKEAKKYTNQQISLSNRFATAKYVCEMLLPFSHATDLQRNTILKEAKFNLDALQHANRLSQQIKNIGYDTPIKAAHCMALLLDEFNIWDTYCISYGNHAYRSSVKFHTQLGN